MAHGEETRKKVRASYIFDQLTLEVSALRVGVPIATARRWQRDAKIAGDDWNKARAAQLMAGGGIEDIARQTLAAFVQQVQAATQELQVNVDMPPGERAKWLASLADSFAKLMVGHKRLMPETDKLATAMDVLKRQGEFVRARHPKHVGAFFEVLESFADELARVYG